MKRDCLNFRDWLLLLRHPEILPGQRDEVLVVPDERLWVSQRPGLVVVVGVDLLVGVVETGGLVVAGQAGDGVRRDVARLGVLVVAENVFGADRGPVLATAPPPQAVLGLLSEVEVVPDEASSVDPAMAEPTSVLTQVGCIMSQNTSN